MDVEAIVVGNDALTPDLHEKFVHWLKERFSYNPLRSAAEITTTQHQRDKSEVLIALGLDKDSRCHSLLPEIREMLSIGKRVIIFATVLERELLLREFPSFPQLKIENIYSLREALRHGWSGEIETAFGITH